MMEAIKRGIGLGFIPDFVCKDAIASGELIEVLP
jgi:DNA-binding transcriptional LysR family regulator